MDNNDSAPFFFLMHSFIHSQRNLLFCVSVALWHLLPVASRLCRFLMWLFEFLPASSCCAVIATFLPFLLSQDFREKSPQTRWIFFFSFPWRISSKEPNPHSVELLWSGLPVALQRAAGGNSGPELVVSHMKCVKSVANCSSSPETPGKQRAVGRLRSHLQCRPAAERTWESPQVEGGAAGAAGAAGWGADWGTSIHYRSGR